MYTLNKTISNKNALEVLNKLSSRINTIIHVSDYKNDNNIQDWDKELRNSISFVFTNSDFIIIDFYRMGKFFSLCSYNDLIQDNFAICKNLSKNREIFLFQQQKITEIINLLTNNETLNNNLFQFKLLGNCCQIILGGKSLKISYISKGGKSLQSIILEKIFKEPREHIKNSKIHWDELLEDDHAMERYNQKKKIKNAIYCINKNAKDKLDTKLFIWNNGEITICK